MHTCIGIASFSKVLERVVNKQLYSYFEANKLLSEITILADSIRQNMDKRLMTRVVFLDLRKVFDTVDHSRIISKLSLYEIRDKELAFLESFLFE